MKSPQRRRNAIKAKSVPIISPVFLPVLLLLLSLIGSNSCVTAFTIFRVAGKTTVQANTCFSRNAIFLQDSLESSSMPITFQEEGTSTKFESDHNTIVDRNGREFTVGAIARIVVDNLKAYQVSVKGQGSYNEKKEFVPLDTEQTEKGRYLVLPVGIRGTITKVYNVDEVSANFPIQVKFEPGKNTDEGYDPPVPFVMHFLEQEIEVVVA